MQCMKEFVESRNISFAKSLELFVVHFFLETLMALFVYLGIKKGCFAWQLQCTPSKLLHAAGHNKTLLFLGLHL
jgi:hypothetical protein